MFDLLSTSSSWKLRSVSNNLNAFPSDDGMVIVAGTAAPEEGGGELCSHLDHSWQLAGRPAAARPACSGPVEGKVTRSPSSPAELLSVFLNWCKVVSLSTYIVGYLLMVKMSQNVCCKPVNIVIYVVKLSAEVKWVCLCNKPPGGFPMNGSNH